MEAGRFISFEGGEGAGKSTQIARLAAFIEVAGLTVKRTREPGGAPGAEQIRALLVEGEIDRWDPLAETLLHMAARRNHLEAVILPALATGAWILCDRFADSTEAYQGYAQGVDLTLIRTLRQAVVGGSEPDLTIVLDIPVEVGLARANSRDSRAGRYERMDIALHRRVREAFREIALASPDRCVVIDATGLPDAIEAEIRHCVTSRFPLKPLHGR